MTVPESNNTNDYQAENSSMQLSFVLITCMISRKMVILHLMNQYNIYEGKNWASARGSVKFMHFQNKFEPIWPWVESFQ